MAIVIDVEWVPALVKVQRASLPIISASPEIRELDVHEFHHVLRLYESSEQGIAFTRIHDHLPETTISGDIYARTVVVLAPYMVEFEDGQYAVKCVGANHNIADRKVANQVSIIVGNSAGLIRSPGVDAANVQSAMTLQGYTVARAPSLDLVDQPVSSRSVPGDAMAITPAASSDLVQAIVAEAQASGILTADQATQLSELWRLAGLQMGGELVVQPTQRTAPGIWQTVTTVGTTTKVKRI